MRALIDRMLTGVVWLALRGFFRRLEVEGRDLLPHDRPVLLVANHFNALVDAVLVIHALGRLPRFVAKSTLWRPVWARPLLWLAGLVPVHRPQDGPLGADHNRSMFVSCHEHLARGKTVALFPEGRISPVPRPQAVRTGAARIALGAREAGAEGLAIVPVGLVYEDKVALRSGALVRIGAPIDVDGALARAGEAQATASDQAVVRRLTDEIERRLRDLAPTYRDEREGAVLGYAAEIALREPDRLPPVDVPLSRREALARRLAATSSDVREEVVDHVARFHLGLWLLGLRDAYLVGDYRLRSLTRLLVVTALRLAVLAPIAVAGAVVNVLPYGGVHWSGRLLLREATWRSSARLLVGVVLFPAAWLLTAWLVPWDAWWVRTSVVVAAPVAGLVAVRALEEAIAVHRAWRGWIALLERGGELDRLRRDRALLVEHVVRASN